MRLLLYLLLIACLAQAGLYAANVEQFLGRKRLGGSIWGLRNDMEEAGVFLDMGFDGEIWSNVHGGITTGTKLLGLGTVATGFDLETIAGLEGSSIFVDGIWYHGSQPTALLIGADPSSNISSAEAESNFWRVYQIYFQQELFNKALTLRAGQLAADETFMISEYAGLFINAQFGALPTEADNVAAPVYPTPAPGAYGEWSPEEQPWFARVGLYTADAGPDNSHNIGFSWELGGGVGGALFVEGGRSYVWAGMPGKATLGFIGANSPITNYQTGGTERGFYSLYTMVDQALILREDGSARLGAFWRFAWNPQSTRSQQQYYTDCGFNLFQPFPNRPRDIAGVAVGYERFYGYFRASQAALGGPSVTDDQTVLEFTYSASLNDWLVVQPDFQMIFDPEFSGRDAYVVGMRASLVF